MLAVAAIVIVPFPVHLESPFLEQGKRERQQNEQEAQQRQSENHNSIDKNIGFSVTYGLPPTGAVFGPEEKIFLTPSLIILEEKLYEHCYDLLSPPRGFFNRAVVIAIIRDTWLDPPPVQGFWVVFKCFHKADVPIPPPLSPGFQGILP